MNGGVDAHRIDDGRSMMMNEEEEEEAWQDEGMKNKPATDDPMGQAGGRDMTGHDRTTQSKPRLEMANGDAIAYRMNMSFHQSKASKHRSMDCIKHHQTVPTQHTL